MVVISVCRRGPNCLHEVFWTGSIKVNSDKLGGPLAIGLSYFSACQCNIFRSARSPELFGRHNLCLGSDTSVVFNVAMTREIKDSKLAKSAFGKIENSFWL